MVGYLKSQAELLAELKRARQQFQDFVDNAPIGIYRTTPEGQILLANPALVRMLGYDSFEDLAARDLEAAGFEPDYSRGDFKELIERTGEVRGLEVAWKRRDGTVIHLSENARVVRDGKGAILYYEGTVEDITDRHRAQQELLEARDRAEAASRAKSDFLANMGHELRTPLGGIIGLTEILLSTGLTEEQRRYISTMRRSAEALAVIINDLLDFSRIEAGRLALHPVPFSPRPALEDVVHMFQVPADEKGLELGLGVDPRVPDRVIGDAGRIRQILINLVDNAVKFTAQGTVGIRVECLECDRLQTVLRISVSDSGIGIPVKKIEEVFEKFTQVDTSARRRYGGTGLGLAISRRLVGMMGSELQVESQPGQGSTFWFDLELPRIADPAEPDRTPPDRTSPDAPGDVPPVALVVEDNPVNQEVITTILERLGWRVETASGGQEALERSAQRDFDLIFMDCQMPGMDGFDTTARIREREQATGRRSRIVAMTAHSLEEDRQRCFAAGMDEYLAKPASMEDFRTVLGKLGF